MDADASYPLVPVQQRELVVAEFCDDACCECQPDLARLWRRFLKLVALFILAVIAIRRLRRQLVELRCQAHYWRAQHERAVQREAALAAQVQHLQGELRELKRRYYGRKTETSATTSPKGDANRQGPRRRRGQQRGSKGHGRRNHDHLPTTHEDCTLPDDQKCCPDCGEPLEEIPGTADGDILEIDVRAHRRRYHRHRYRRC